MDSYASMVLGGDERNAEKLGVIVAWLINNHMLDPMFEKKAGRVVVRVRMQDLTGADFLSTILHGELKPSHLTQAGREFTERYFLSAKFDEDYAKSSYSGDREWIRYEEVSPHITRAYRGHVVPLKEKRGIAKILQFPSRKKSDD